MNVAELKELVANEFGLSTRAVEKQIANLRKERRLHRVVPKKGGY